jgi:hypothetical protein
MSKQIGLVIALILIGGAGAARVTADQSCKPVVGSFEARVVPPPDCLAVFCTEGRVWGGLQGTYAFTMPTPPISSGFGAISFFTGDSDVTTKSGDHVFGKDTGTIDFGPDGGFASLITFTGGTGALAGTSGQIRLRGQLDPVAFTTSGDYLGTICTP